MSFDEEHLDEHFLCQREVAERDQRIADLERGLRELHNSTHKPGCICWVSELVPQKGNESRQYDRR